MAKLIKKSTDKKDGEKKALTKLHVGCDIHVGESGYTSMKDLVKLLKKSHDINDRKMLLSIAGELNPKFDNAWAIVESTFKSVGLEIVDKSPEQIAKIITG